MRRPVTVTAALISVSLLLLAAVLLDTAPSARHCRANDYSLGCALPPAPEAFTAPRVYATGIDFGWGGPSAGTMRAHGWRFGASYLSPDFSKNWHVGQLREYEHAGIARVFVWESTANRALEGCLAGTSDALAARGQIGTRARVVYFAVDFEQQPWQVEVIGRYFHCAERVLGVAHTGAYGGYWTIRHLFDAHLIAYGWQTYAWSGGRWDGRAQLQQYLNGNAYDLDRAVGPDYGQTPYSAPTPKPQPKPQPSPRPVSERRARLKALLHRLIRLERTERTQLAVTRKKIAHLKAELK